MNSRLWRIISLQSLRSVAILLDLCQCFLLSLWHLPANISSSSFLDDPRSSPMRRGPVKEVLRKHSVWHSGVMAKPAQTVCSYVRLYWIYLCMLQHSVSNPVKPSYPKYSPQETADGTPQSDVAAFWLRSKSHYHIVKTTHLYILIFVLDLMLQFLHILLNWLKAPEAFWTLADSSRSIVLSLAIIVPKYVKSLTCCTGFPFNSDVHCGFFLLWPLRGCFTNDHL